jgi:hypothetical protein
MTDHEAADYVEQLDPSTLTRLDATPVRAVVAAARALEAADASLRSEV